MSKPIEIFVRQCYHSPNSDLPNRKRPEWFSKEKCWINLLTTQNREMVNVNIIYDNHYRVGEAGLFFGRHGIDITEINAGTEAKSFLATLDIIISRNLLDETIIYLLEDDYLHKPRFCEVLLEGFTLPIRYATLYDHADKYKDYPDLKSQIFVTPNCHWRTVPSTTNTFACKMRTLREDIEIHRKHSTGVDISQDNAKFIELGGVISSIPGFSTHCDDYLSPAVDWQGLL